MKKIIIGLSAVVLAVFVIILFVNAQNGPKEDKKVSTGMSKSCGKCPSAVSCGMIAETQTNNPEAKACCDKAKCEAKACCDKAKCKEMGCDPAKCQANCSAAKCEMKKCDQAKCSDTKCGMKKCGPAECKGSSEK